MLTLTFTPLDVAPLNPTAFFTKSHFILQGPQTVRLQEQEGGESGGVPFPSPSVRLRFPKWEQIPPPPRLRFNFPAGLRCRGFVSAQPRWGMRIFTLWLLGPIYFWGAVRACVCVCAFEGCSWMSPKFLKATQQARGLPNHGSISALFALECAFIAFAAVVVVKLNMRLWMDGMSNFLCVFGVCVWKRAGGKNGIKRVFVSPNEQYSLH